ncbi:MAG: ABC transporter ATP-binding protein [Bacteroidetes bacterium]|nr:ABC transporter ATP-binding protein [Bacteroidota bacterium]
MSFAANVDFFIGLKQMQPKITMNALASLNHYLWKYRGRLALGLLFIIGSNLFAVFPAGLIQESIDLVSEYLKELKANPSAMDKQTFFDALIKLAGLIFLFALCKGILLFMVRQTIIITSRWIEYDLKNDVFAHYQNMDLGFFRRHATGDLMNRLSEDISNVRMYLGPVIMYGLNTLVLFVLVLGMMLKTSPFLTLLVFVPMPILSALVYLVNKRILSQSTRVQEALSSISSFVQEFISGIRIVKAYGRQPEFENRFESQSEGYRKEAVRLMVINAVFFPLILLLIGISTVLAVGVGGWEVYHERISPGVIAEFIIYVNLLTWPVASLGWITSIWQRAEASQIRINEFLETKSSLPEGRLLPTEGAFELEFHSVGFVYPETGIRALTNVSFKLEKNQVLGITGKTGSGKSSIALLMMRFYDPTEGKITLNGEDLRSYSLSALRSVFSFVPQDVFLFSDTIENNIRFGATDSMKASQEEVIQASVMAGLHENVMEFSEAYQTRLGERGVTLSGGQKQRSSIARALIQPRPCLVLDDALSAVDTSTEREVLNHLKRLNQRSAIVLISHRLSTLQPAERILVLDQGQAVEFGPPSELLQAKGLYWQFFEQQSPSRVADSE